MSLSIGKHAEGHAGHLLSGLDDSPTEFLCARERSLNVFNAYEEKDGNLTALERTIAVGAPSWLLCRRMCTRARRPPMGRAEER